MNNKAGIPALLASPSPLSRRHFHELFLMACTDPVINSCPFQYQLYSAKTLKSHFSYRKLNYLKETLFRYITILPYAKKSVIASLLLSILKNIHLPLYHNLFPKVIFYFPISFLRNLRKLFSLSLSLFFNQKLPFFPLSLTLNKTVFTYCVALRHL